VNGWMRGGGLDISGLNPVDRVTYTRIHNYASNAGRHSKFVDTASQGIKQLLMRLVELDPFTMWLQSLVKRVFEILSVQRIQDLSGSSDGASGREGRPKSFGFEFIEDVPRRGRQVESH
jgi:hypothetical protein